MDQKEFEWDFSRQVRVIRASVFKPVPVAMGKKEAKPKNVSTSSIKNLLTAIHSRSGVSGWCWASLETLATDCGLSRTQIRRTLAALHKLDLLAEKKERRGRSFRVYRRIVFPNLMDHVPIEDGPHDAPTSPAIETAPSPQPPAIEEPNSQGNGESSQGNESRSQGNGESFTGQPLPPKYPLNTISKNPLKSPDESKKIDGKNGKWCLKPDINIEDLRKPEAIQELYDLAVERGLFLDAEAYRLGFFGLCVRMAEYHDRTRRSKPWVNAVGLLHKLLEQGPNEWGQHVSDDENRKWAEKAIRFVDDRIGV